MFYRTLGRTGLKFSSIGIGAGAFNLAKDPSLSMENARKCVEVCVKGGVNFIDIGKDYDEGLVSEVIGGFAGRLHKVCRSYAEDYNAMSKDIEESSKKLGPKVDVYGMNVNSMEELRKKIGDGVLESLQDAKRDGKIGFTCIFSHKAEVLEEAVKTGAFDVVTSIYNAVNRRCERLFALREKHNFGFLAASPFATGTLVDPKYDENVRMQGSDFMNAENALRFVLSSDGVDAAIIGMKTPRHAAENIAAVEKGINITEAERSEISRTMENFLGNDFCRMCRHCEGCSSISVADVLRLLTIHKRYGYTNYSKWAFEQIKPNLGGLDFAKCQAACPYSLDVRKLVDEAISELGD
jgi:predicted aldo/keto reductase-like oxidoreductase